MRHIHSSAVLIAIVGLIAQGCGTRSNNDQRGSVKSLAETVTIVRTPEGTYQVTCRDGSVETATEQQILSNAICVAGGATTYKTCRTAADVRNHIGATPRAKLVGTDGKTVSNINERFCVHTVADGSKPLVVSQPVIDGESEAPTVTRGLMVAIADVGHGAMWGNPHSDGATFEEAQQACAALSLLGKKWTAPASMNTFAKPREEDPGRSIEAIAPYMYDPQLGDKQFANGDWWSSSMFAAGLAYSWHFGGFSSYVFYYDTNYTHGVRCLANR